MEELLLVLVTGWLLFVGSGVVGVAYCRWRLRRRLRVRPEVPSAAPTLWLVPGTASSRLHLRLRRVAAVARTAGATDPSLGPLAADVVDHAATLEAQLLVVARGGRWAAPSRRAIDFELRRLEGVGARLAGNARPPGYGPALGPAQLGPVDDLGERLASLEAARREVAALEQTAGLRPGSQALSARAGLPAR
jgi:hypothetical protein